MADICSSTKLHRPKTFSSEHAWPSPCGHTGPDIPILMQPSTLLYSVCSPLNKFQILPLEMFCMDGKTVQEMPMVEWR